MWLAVAAVLSWTTAVCLLGSVEHRLTPRQMRGRGPTVEVTLPAPSLPWPGDLDFEVLEDGTLLGSAGTVEPRGVIRHRGLGAQTLVEISFTGSDGTHPRRNGREYVVRIPRREFPAAIALVLAGWILLPLAVLRRSVLGAAPLDATAWSVGVLCVLYSCFAVQAWLEPSHTPWLLALAAVSLPSCLNRFGSPLRPLPDGLLWLLGLLAWAITTVLAGTSYASWSAGIGLVVLASWGFVAYWGLRGSLGQSDSGPLLLLGVFVFTAGLSFARDAGFDITDSLASLGLSSRWSGPISNPWTSKFVGHWLLVLGWSTLAALWRNARPGLRNALVVVILGTVALGLNASKAALTALALSALVAAIALRWPKPTRRVVVSGIVLGVLLAPLWAAVPWRLHAAAPDHSVWDTTDLEIRGGIWEFSRRLVSQHPLEGWGFGASATLPGRELPIADALGLEPQPESSKLSRHPVLAGGHPHNAALQTWLDLGLVGALLVAGLLIALGRSIAAAEENRGVHAALLGLLTVTAVFLAFNYPVWEPEVLSILWMTAALASVGLPSRVAPRKELLRSGIAVAILLALGCAVLAQDRLSRWLTVRDLRPGEVVLDWEERRLTGREKTWPLRYEADLDAGAELVNDQWIRGWTFGPPGQETVDAVLVFVGSRLAGVTVPERPSPEAFSRTESRDVRALTAGFLVPAGPDLDLDTPVTVVVLRADEALAKTLPSLGAALSGDDTQP